MRAFKLHPDGVYHIEAAYRPNGWAMGLCEAHGLAVGEPLDLQHTYPGDRCAACVAKTRTQPNR